MSTLQPTIERVAEILPEICAVDTAAADGEAWSKDNPTWGHCAAASLLVQKLFGGELLRISLEGTEFADSRSHYYNRLPDSTLVDVTEAQFQGRLDTRSLPAETRTRDYVINGADTRIRYAHLANRFLMELFSDNALFQDALYRNCLYQAYLSPCKKAGFGAIIPLDAVYVAVEHNRPIEALCDMCKPDCMRFRIASRTDSMLGACGHAEEWAMKSARDIGIDLSECELYVAGTTQNGLPWLKEKVSFTCLRCAVAIYYAGIQKVWVPVVDHWEALTSEECLVSAKQYALGKEKA